MTAEREMAQAYAKYGDVIVAFVVVQTLTFIYALGHEGPLRDAIRLGWAQVMRILLYAGFGYVVSIAFCGYWEHSLRICDAQSLTVQYATLAASFGRCAIVIGTIFLSRYALRLNKPDNAKAV